VKCEVDRVLILENPAAVLLVRESEGIENCCFKVYEDLLTPVHSHFSFLIQILILYKWEMLSCICCLVYGIFEIIIPMTCLKHPIT
jgi:hypothetical protein